MSATAERPGAAHVGTGALAGLKVVEFGAFAAGPAVGKHLADHGAEVVRIESRHRPDGFRTNYPPYKDNLPGIERAGMFAMTNNNKLGITLNLKTEGGRSMAARLIERADVVIENFTPGTIDRLGLGHAEMSARNLGLVTLSTCNQGATGPNAHRAGFGTQLTALSGFTHLTGWPDRVPALLWGPFIDYIAVAYGAAAVLAAVDQRRRTGRGCHIDLSQLETGVQLMAPVLLQLQLSGEVATRAGNRDLRAAPHGVFPCAGEERWVALSVHDDAEWSRLATAIGSPAWTADPRFATGPGRLAAVEELEALVGAWTRERTREEVVATLRAAGVHVAPVNDMADLFSDPQLVHRRAFRPLDHAELGPHTVPGPPFALSATPDCVGAPAPLVGEHTRQVLEQLLGLEAAEVDRLEAEGALE